jgi:hypothetical protein
MRNRIHALVLGAIVLVVGGWGPRGHQTSNRAAVRSLPADGPVFLQEHEDWIAKTGPIPDSWRGNTEPYSKIFEDPNHGWFKEQFSFMTSIPRSRYEFVLRLYDEYLKIREKDPERAALTNVRWTGTLPYAAMENFDRMQSSMRLYRMSLADTSAEGRKNAEYLARDIAFYMGWLGHYTADGAMPLHNSIHHDGWVGENKNGYATDPGVHGRFESSFVELIQLSENDLMPLVAKPQVLADPFVAILAHLDASFSHVKDVYELDKAKAFADPKNLAAAQLVKQQLAGASTLLRDLTYTAWVNSGKPIAGGRGAANTNPISRTHPQYNPETGSAPPATGVKQEVPKQ